jgi:tRNA pseudouridine38-40 synthase
LKPTNKSATSSDETKNLEDACLYRLDLNYIGADYLGFQSQPNGQTVQDQLEKALGVFCRHPVRITAASRTDTGVHAEHQVVTFKTKAGLDSARLVKGLNALLPSNIRIMNALPVVSSFHPIFNCTGKVYRYKLWRSHGESSFANPLTWKLVGDLDIDAMRHAATVLIGRHDFTSFCASDSSAKSKIRNLREIVIIERGPLLELWFLGDGFLKQMIRNLVGALVAIGRKKISIEQLMSILAARDRSQAPETAPAEGLCLMRIFYGDDANISTLLEPSTSGYNHYL